MLVQGRLGPEIVSSVGDGLYKTVDGGANWNKIGFENSERIANIIVNPNNSLEIYVGVLGALWGDNKERGVYKSTDGGTTWESCCISTQKRDVQIWPWIQQTPMSFMPPCGSLEEQGGPLNLEAKTVHFINLSMLEKLGTKSIMVFQKENWEDWPLRLHLQTQIHFYTVIEAEKNERKGLYRSNDAGASWNN